LELPVKVVDPQVRAKIGWARNSLVDHLIHLEGITPYPTQEHICNRLEVGYRELLTVFREFGKSTIGEALAAHELAYRKDVFVYYFAYTTDAVLPRLNTIRDFFERDVLPTGGDNPFRQLVPKKKGSSAYKWGGTKFALNNGNMFYGGGADSFVLGAKERKIRPTLIIIDDPVHPDKMNSDKKLIQDWFRKTISNLGGPMTRIIVIGTTRRHSDLIMFLLSKESVYNKHYYPAIDNHGNVTVPEHWLRKGGCCTDLENPAFRCHGLNGEKRILQHIKQKQEEILSVAWSTEFMLQPVDDGSSLFPMNILKESRKRNLTFDYFREKFQHIIDMERDFGKKLARPITVIGCDHAISESKDADFTVFSVMMLNPKTNERTLIDRWKKRGVGIREQIEQLRIFNKLYRPSIVYSEKNGFQRVFAREVAEYQKEIPIAEFFTQYNKAALEIGIPSMKSYFEMGSYLIPYGDPESKEHADDLFLELNGISLVDGKIISNTANDDGVLSFWITDTAALDALQFSYGIASINMDGITRQFMKGKEQVEIVRNFGNSRSTRDFYR